MRKSVLDSPAYQPLRPSWRNGFNSYSRIPANLFLSALKHLAIQKFQELLGFRRAGLPLDSDIDIFRILTKDHDVHLFGMCDRGGNSLVITDRAFARIQIQNLSQRDVERAYATTDRSGQRPFDRHAKIANGVDGVVRQPFLEFVERLFARKNLKPGDMPLAAIRAVHSGVKHSPGSFPDIAPDSVAFDKRDNRRIRHAQLAAAVLDGLSSGRNGLAVITA